MIFSSHLVAGEGLWFSSCHASDSAATNNSLSHSHTHIHTQTHISDYSRCQGVKGSANPGTRLNLDGGHHVIKSYGWASQLHSPLHWKHILLGKSENTQLWECGFCACCLINPYATSASVSVDRESIYTADLDWCIHDLQWYYFHKHHYQMEAYSLLTLDDW